MRSALEGEPDVEDRGASGRVRRSGNRIIMTPELAAPLFATSNSSGASATYIRAIAIRDIVIGLCLVVGPYFSIAGTTMSIAAISVIPCGDLVLVWLSGGGLLSLLPHVGSVVSLLALAAWRSRVA
ncbi:DUF4267 domain-containing protein [Rhizobium brockwellii]